MINFVSIPSPRATILLSKWLFILSIPSWCSTKGVHKVILFLSVTPYFPQTRVPGVCYGNHRGTKVGVTWWVTIAMRKLNYGKKKTSEKICNFAKGNTWIKSTITSWCELSRSERNSLSCCYFKWKGPVSWQTNQNQPKETNELLKIWKSNDVARSWPIKGPNFIYSSNTWLCTCLIPFDNLRPRL